jgi:hypothetical protein
MKRAGTESSASDDGAENPPKGTERQTPMSSPPSISIP